MELSSVVGRGGFFLFTLMDFHIKLISRGRISSVFVDNEDGHTLSCKKRVHLNISYLTASN